MSGSLNTIAIEDVRFREISFTGGFLIGFETGRAEQPLPVLLRSGERYYPVCCLNLLRETAATADSVRALVAPERTAALDLMHGLHRGSFNFVEKLFMLKNYGAAGNMPAGNLEKYLPLLTLPESALTMIAEGRLSPGTALLLADVSAANREEFLGIAASFRLNANQQREALSHFMDLARSRGDSFHDIAAALAIPEAPGRQSTANELMLPLRAMAMPRFHATLHRFGELKNELRLPRKINLKETPYFEAKTLSLELFFSSLGGLEKAAASLAENIRDKKGTWEEIFRLL